MSTYYLAIAATLGLLPAAAVLLVVLDRYAAPKVAVSVFDERKLFLAYVVGIPAGTPLALVFVLFAGYSQGADWGGLFITLALFVTLSLLTRRLFLRIRRFGGPGGRGRQSPFYAFGFGTGIGTAIAFGASLWEFQLSSVPLETYPLLLGLSVVVVLLESWIGLRTAHDLRDSPSRWPALMPLLLEAAVIAGFIPFYLGYAEIRVLVLLGLVILLSLFLWIEEWRALRPSLPTGSGTGRFSRQGEEGTKGRPLPSESSEAPGTPDGPPPP